MGRLSAASNRKSLGGGERAVEAWRVLGGNGAGGRGGAGAGAGVRREVGLQWTTSDLRGVTEMIDEPEERRTGVMDLNT